MKNEMWKNALMNIDEKYIAEASEYAPEEEKAPENAVFIGNSPKNSSSRKSSGNIWFVVASAVAVIGCIIGVNAVFGGKEAEINVSSPSSDKVYDTPETTAVSSATEVPVTTTVPITTAGSLTYATTTVPAISETEVTTVTLDIDYIKSEQERIDEILAEQQGNIGEIIESLEEEIALLKDYKEAFEMHIRHYEAEIDDREEMVDVLTEQKEASESQERKENLQDEIEALQEEIRRLEGVIDAYKVSAEDFGEMIEDCEKKMEEYRKELEIYAEETEAVETVAPEPPFDSETASALNNMYFVSPVERPDKITTYYGYDEWTGGSHSGIDYGWAEDCYGSDIYATAEGTVKEVDTPGTADTIGYGNYIIIDHGNGIETFYAHCGEILAKEGEAVKQGQVIAKIGSTGFSTGPHLHYELRVNGEPVDPTPYFLVRSPCIPALSLASPVDKAKDRVTEYFGGYEGHNGMDFAWDGCHGAHVYASESGTVSFTGWDDRLGNYIIIDHGLAKTVYAQLSSIYVKEGQEVGKSDVIGSIGNTGTVTGSHLHFELIIDGEYSDPMFYMSDFNPNAQG
ncbi:MAG: peptidoglycan DD-metalloendopeptidase family protein [Ruminiclostridium sp.]|nr:peptidoglycan DD-metalloendopeptidase family protein [Ruminiclostridium sp.]